MTVALEVMDVNCYECVCPRLPAVEEHQRSVNDSIKRIERTLDDQGKKMDGINRIGIGLLCSITVASVLMVINIIIERG